MSVYESIMQGLTEAVDYQQGKILARKTGLSQVIFAGSLEGSPKTAEAWENGRNRPEGASRCLLEIVRDNLGFLQRFQA